MRNSSLYRLFLFKVNLVSKRVHSRSTTLVLAPLSRSITRVVTARPRSSDPSSKSTFLRNNAHSLNIATSTSRCELCSYQQMLPPRTRSKAMTMARSASKCEQGMNRENEEPLFQPRRAVILTKMTRFEYERKLCNRMSDQEFQEYLESKDSDYFGLLERHRNHYVALDVVRKELLKSNIETRVVERFSLDQNVVDWADVVFTAGGDGTYLLAANKILNTSKPLIGINTDPERSEGHLCLPKSDFAAVNFGRALKRLLKGDFVWKWRQRIEVTMSGRHINDDPIELHDQQLIFPEHRFIEHIAEDEEVRILKPTNGSGKLHPSRRLPCLALNEVFVGESLSSRVSYYEIATDTNPKEKQKSSGVTICTGTGSSSWHFHMNHLSNSAVKQVLGIANQVSGCDYPIQDEEMTEEIMNSFNNSLRFDSSLPFMAYTIRDPIKNAVFHVERASGFAKKITIRSRMWDACLVIDGGMSFKFNDGAIATFQIAENNALRTVSFD